LPVVNPLIQRSETKMQRLTGLFLLLLFPALTTWAAGPGSSSPAGETVHHELRVELHPDQASIRARARITLPDTVTVLVFLLHADLDITATPTGTIHTIDEVAGSRTPLRQHTLRFDTPRREIDLAWAGRLAGAMSQRRDGYAGGYAETTGMITADGVFLAGSSGWYPLLDSPWIRFSLVVGLPPGWHAVSQGEALPGGGWLETRPQDEIYLIAAPYHQYSRAGAVATAMVYLREPDAALADRYLEATGRYLALYQQLLGPYPYDKFALVENFWETGYGMPSFTLLGPRVIRLPFIIETSYPHEVLHNWWGNGVYVDYASGNWSEGLTAYLADHLLKEQQGQGADYRRDILQAYADHVSNNEDLALVDFRARHGRASQAAGYGRMLMLLHMLRQKLGDAVFIDGLRRFYADNLFRVASFGDLRRAFETASGQDLLAFFTQWTTRTGAPQLALGDVAVEREAAGYTLTLTLLQEQGEPPFILDVPVYIQLEGSATPVQRRLTLDSRATTVNLSLPQRPLRIAVDPRFATFRRLDRSEIPASLAQLFAADRLHIVLPATAPEALRRAYRQLAEEWRAAGTSVTIHHDNQIEELPGDAELWVFGRENRFVAAVTDHVDEILPGLLAGNRSLDGISGAMAWRDPDDEHSMGLLLLADPRQLSALARKLPHYGKYSHVLFADESLTRPARGQWPLPRSALVHQLGEDALPPMRYPEEPVLARQPG